MPKELLKFIVILCLFSTFFPLSSILAQDRKLEIEYPKIFGIKPEYVSVGLPEYVKYIFNFSIAIFGVIVFGAVIYGGFLYLTSVGDPTKIKEAKDQISSAFLGISVLLLSYLIFVTINPELVIFEVPPLIKLPETTISPPAEIPKSEVTLILEELPLGQLIEKKLWSKERINRLGDLATDTFVFLNQNIEIEGREGATTTIADLNKYLKQQTESCKCQNLKGVCTKPSDFAQPIGCEGDPCPDEAREIMNKIYPININKEGQLIGFKQKFDEEIIQLEEELNKLSEIEQRITESQFSGLATRNEYLSLLAFFQEQGWNLTATSQDSFPKSQGDPLTFYRPASGNYLEYLLSPKLPPEFPSEIPPPPPELIGAEPQEVTGAYVCQAQIPLGEVLHEVHKLATSLILNFTRIADLLEKMAARVLDMNNYANQCTKKDCSVTCGCVYNPCYLLHFLFTELCSHSPCLQDLEHCQGEACPKRADIEKVVKEIKDIQEDILELLGESRMVLQAVPDLIAGEGNPKNLKNVREGMKLCYTADIEAEIQLNILTCEEAIGAYNSEGLVIGSCYPGNYFCCNYVKISPPAAPETHYYIDNSLKYEPIATITEGCPEGYRCDPDVKDYNQYNDASEPLKKLLACMTDELKKIQEDPPIGRISSISDSHLYTQPQLCDWLTGPILNVYKACSHKFEVTSLKRVISCHYGGPERHSEEKSYAVDFGLTGEPLKTKDYLETVAETCTPSVFLNPEKYIDKQGNVHTHLHISIGTAEKCGCDK